MSDTAPETGDTPTPTEPPEEAATAPNLDELAAEVDKWKAQSRKNEERAKANAAAAKELEALKASTMSETEKAVAEAKAAGRAEALAELGAARVEDAVRVALAGRNADVDALLEGMDRSRFLDDDGQPDRDGIAAWVDRIAPAPTEPPTPVVPDLGQGVRGAPVAGVGDDALTQTLMHKLGAG